MKTETKRYREDVYDAQLRSLVAELESGRRLIASVNDVAYCRTANGSGSVGGQFRHNLDFVGSLLKGLANGRIDYNDRDRDTLVETDRTYALERFAVLLQRLKALGANVMGQDILVRSEVDMEIWLSSSVAREAEFVHSHTVHHHALIAEKLAGFGVTVADNFGVAPSTIEYWKKRAA